MDRQVGLFDLHEEDGVVEEQNESYKGIYAMHKYWGKKPFNVISKFIERYSKPDDIVLDPFCGSGVTSIESIRSHRRTIGIDLNPIAVQLTRVSLQPVDIRKVKEEFSRLRTELEGEISELYSTQCSCCGKLAMITHAIWDNGSVVEVWYSCESCNKKKIVRLGNETDVEAAIHPKGEFSWYPTTKLFYNSRINVSRDERVSELFTPRALMALSWIYNRISKIEDDAIRETFETVFTGALSQASKLVFVIRNRKKGKLGDEIIQRAEVGSWVIGYWIPDEHFEINAWNCFVNRYNRVLRGKAEVNSIFPHNIKLSGGYREFIEENTPALISLGNAMDLPLPDSCIDYVFTDPPHANRILYMEMSLMWNSWLRKDGDCYWDREIVISESKERDRTSETYNLSMEIAIREIYRVLKPNRFMSIAFNSLDSASWISLLNSCLHAGFEVHDILPLEYSATSVVQDNRQNALKTDFVISCKKPYPKEAIIKDIAINNDVSCLMKKIASIVSNPLETYEIINIINIASIREGMFWDPKLIIDTLKTICDFSEGKWILKKGSDKGGHH